MTRSAGRAGRIVRGSRAKFPAGSTAGVPEIILAARSFRSACHEGATGRIHDEEELGAPRTPDIRDGRYADLIHGAITMAMSRPVIKPQFCPQDT